MGRAAGDGAAGGQAAIAASCSTDPGTLSRVIAALRGQMAGADPLSRHEHLGLPVTERRTLTLLWDGTGRR